MVFININKKNENNFKNSLDNLLKKDHVFILIYMEGCGPCNQVRPEWEKLKNVLKKYKNNDKIIIIDIDNDSLEKLNSLSPPSSFPTIKYITNKGNIMENYEDSNISLKDRSIDSFVEWIDTKTKNNTIKNNTIKNNTIKNNTQMAGKKKYLRNKKWTQKYKRSINCRFPKGFSQKQFCKYSKKNK